MGAQRIYLIGAGIIAHSHAHAAYGLPLASQEVQLSVADPNTRVLEEFATQFPEARTFTDANIMLAEDAQDSDIVIVATPPATHCQLSIAALATGRHVLCEKPLAMDQVEAGKMLAAARSQRRLLGCCSVRYFEWPPAEEARRFLQAGALGRVYHIRFHYLEPRNRPGVEYQPGTLWFLDQAKSGGGTLMDRAPYEFSTLNDLFQPVRVDVLSAWLANPTTALRLPGNTIVDVEQHAGATLRYHFADGDTCMLSYERASCTHSEERADIEVEGLQGTLRWPWPRSGAPLHLTHSYDVDGLLESKTISFARPALAQMGYKPLHYFYQRMLGRPSRAVVNEQAVFNFACVRAIYDCARSGQPQTVVSGE